jgi:hypothetical protein
VSLARLRLPLKSIAVTTALSLALSSCAISGLEFRQDNRLSIVSPTSLAVVKVPFTLRWTMSDFQSGPNTMQGGNDYFAVFVDRQPMAPGAGLKVLGDATCQATPGCPNMAYLEQNYVFLTAKTQLTITSLPELLPSSTRNGTKESHEIDIVLMNGSNHRIGESAWYVDFFSTFNNAS